MSDPFRGTPGIMGGTGADIAAVVQIGAVQAAKERAIAAFRHNIALPDVHVANRTEDFVPVVVGQDGAPMTPERRAEIMKASGVKPMFDANGEPTGQRYDQSFTLVQPERIGESAERNRHQIRVVETKKLTDDALRQGNLGEATVASTEGDLYIPGTEAVVGSLGKGCVYTSGCGAPVRPIDFLRHIREAMTKLVEACVTPAGVHVGVKHCTMSSPAHLFVKRYLGDQGIRVETTLLGVRIDIDPSCENEIRFHGDYAYPAFATMYASVFIPKVQYERALHAYNAAQDETAIIDIDVEET